LDILPKLFELREVEDKKGEAEILLDVELGSGHFALEERKEGPRYMTTAKEEKQFKHLKVSF